MKQTEVCEIAEYLTFGGFVAKMYALSDDYYGNQSKFFSGLFRSYCEKKSCELNMDWIPASNSVSLLMRKAHGAPRNLYRHYCNYDTGALRDDVDQYVSRGIATQKQYIRHMEQLTALVGQSNNLDEMDREYILECTTSVSGEALRELIYRALFVLFREPSG